MAGMRFIPLLLLPCFLHAQDERIIFHSPDACETTQWAARKLQRLLLVAGCNTSPPISLVADESLPHDGYEIRTEKNGIIIAGNDTKPEGTWMLPSHGTLWGVLEFAERFLGVRWLFPGPLGEDVPKRKSLHIGMKETIRGQPGFAARSLAYVGESDREISHRFQSVLDWMKHQRLTNSLHPFATGYGHSWDDYLKPADIAAHPEWKPSSGNLSAVVK